MFFLSSRRRHSEFAVVSWARDVDKSQAVCASFPKTVQETVSSVIFFVGLLLVELAGESSFVA